MGTGWNRGLVHVQRTGEGRIDLGQIAPLGRQSDGLVLLHQGEDLGFTASDRRQGVGTHRLTMCCRIEGTEDLTGCCWERMNCPRSHAERRDNSSKSSNQVALVICPTWRRM